MKCSKIALLFCLFLWGIFAYGQEKHIQKTTKERPTVALVLSGGGAKGFAEIGTLEAIDELGIPIDYIVGTSMGGAMGAFYAIGYSGKEIAEQVAKQDWSNIFTKKEELTRYAFSFPIKGGIRLPKGIVRGQEVMNILSKYTAGFHGSQAFNKLPIPFACIVTDLETGESIVLEEGFHLRVSLRIWKRVNPSF